MIVRNIYRELDQAMKAKQVIAITGLRRVGKTTTIRYLLNRIKSDNKIYFDLERMEFRRIFSDENYGNIIKAFEIEGIDFNKKAYIALDKIQLVPNITSVIKFVYDSYDVKFLITGSSSFYMKGTFSESLAGRKRLYELWPLSFDEFLRFKDVSVNLPEFEFEPTNPLLISKLQPYYDEYIDYGGFPEVVLSNNSEDKISLLKDILDSYINLDVRFLADFTKADELYSLLKLLSARVGSKIDYSKISRIIGINRHKVKEYLLFLQNTFFIKLLKPFVTNPDREIALQNKIYFSDSGLLNILSKVNSGSLFENTMANQLWKIGDLRYYAKKTGQEIDFILNGDRAIEVKETPSGHDLKILKRRAENIGITKNGLVGRYNPDSGFQSFIWGGAIY